jgi:hypothetical protein
MDHHGGQFARFNGMSNDPVANLEVLAKGTEEIAGTEEDRP